MTTAAIQSIVRLGVVPTALAVTALAAPDARAQQDMESSSVSAPRFEVTPFVGYRFGGSFDVPPADETSSGKSIDLDDDTSYGIDVGLYRDHHSFYELLYSRQQTNLDSSQPALRNVDVTAEYLHFGGTLLFDEEYWFVPYLSFTIGATRLDPKGSYDDETKFSASLGGGVRFPINDRFAATLGARGYLTFIGSDTSLFCSSINGQGTCLLKSSGSTFFQGEALLGLTLKF